MKASASETGPYRKFDFENMTLNVFLTAADSSGELHLSSDSNPKNKVKIAYVNGTQSVGTDYCK